MNANKRMSSIARRIHRAWSRKLFRTFLFIDLVVLALSLYGFCFFIETGGAGAFDFDRARGLRIEEGALDFAREAESLEGWDQARLLLSPANWRNAAHEAVYRYTDDAGVWHEAPIGGFLTALEAAFVPLLLAELFVWLMSRIFGGGYARRALRPLSRMTQSAQQLSARPAPKAAPPQAERLHDLEDAIQSLSPERQGALLSTGDTELKGLEQAVNSLLEKMRAAYAEQARFVSDASHELRTPIAVIQGYANMLDRWGKQDESILNESIAAIKSESEHMKALVEQLLFLARGDSGKQSLQMAPFSLTEMMREVHDEYEMIDRDHQWNVSLEEGVECLGDEGMLKQAARVLVDNAVKYTPPGGFIWLRAYRRGEEACFSVQDSGIGIDAESAPHIFERFFRADASRTAPKGEQRKAPGTGLGLSIAQWIVQRHGGYIEVMSWPDLGTRISVCLPGEAPQTE